jgi:prepilin-type N-terminal cleavage/methylation domain-containing protein
MSAQKYIVRGFTLIELLITIAIIGILSAAVIVGINPAQKIKQANDSKAKSDVGQAATALNSYFTTHLYFPLTTLAAMNTALTGGGDMTTNLTAGTGYTYTYTSYAAAGGVVACNNTTTLCGAASVNSTLQAGAATNSLWCYKTATGTVADVTVCAP